MSQWKSQFDDSEETDNEWKAENLQSPEHRLSLHGVSLVCIFTYLQEHFFFYKKKNCFANSKVY